MNNSWNKPNPSEADIDDVLEELDAAMYRLGKLMASRQTECLKDTGVAAPQYMVLRALGVEGPMRVSDIAGMLGVKNPAASAIVQVLERDGYVSRTHDMHDHRVVHVSLTKSGRERFVIADQRRKELMRHFTAALPAEDLRTLARIHSALAESIARDDT